MFNRCYVSFGAPVLHNTLCVTFFARRRAVPPSLLGGGLATQAAQAGPDIRHVRPPSGFRSLRSPQSAPTRASKPHHGHFDSTGVVSSVAGCAMHMKWPDGIGRVAGIGKTQHEKARTKNPALPALTGHAIGRPLPGRSVHAPTPIIVVVVVVVEYYIYLYILLLFKLAVPPLYFPRNNTCCTNYAYKRPGIR